MFINMPTHPQRKSFRQARFDLLLPIVLALILAAAELASDAHGGDDPRPESTGVLQKVDRKIGKQPTYASTPRYALLVLGTHAESKVWVVEDGDLLYVDKNANGDLTDDGPPIRQSSIREFQSPDGPSRDCEYILKAITPANGTKHTDFCLRRWKYGAADLNFGLSLSVDGKIPMYAGWFGTFWASAPESVPLVHFGGPLTPRVLGTKCLTLGAPPDRLGIGFFNPGSGPGTLSWLSIEAVPKDVVPEVQITWPTAPAAPPIKTAEHLTQRCCYWQFYEESLAIPPGVIEGTAKLTVSLPDGALPFALTTNQIELPIHAKAPDTPSK